MLSQTYIWSKHVQNETLTKVDLLLKLPSVCPNSLLEAYTVVLWQFFRLFWRLKPDSQSAVWMGKVWHSSKFKKIRNWILVKLVKDAPKSFHVVTGSPHSKRSVTWRTYLIQHGRQDVYDHLRFDSYTYTNLHCLRVTDEVEGPTTGPKHVGPSGECLNSPETVKQPFLAGDRVQGLPSSASSCWVVPGILATVAKEWNCYNTLGVAC